MKKVLSILLSIFMLAGCFVAMIPAANAADMDRSMAKKGEMIYHEDFEDSAYTSKTKGTLTSALGWGTCGSSLSTCKITTDTTAATGAATPATDPEDHWLEMKSSSEWISGAIFQDERLAGGNYIIEYTQLMTDNAKGDTDGKGLGLLSSNYENPEYTTWRWNFKERGDADLHHFNAGAEEGIKTDNVINDQATVAENYTNIAGEQIERAKGTIVGKVFTIRIYVDAQYGVNIYKVDPETGALSLIAAMGDKHLSTWAATSENIPDSIAFRLLASPTILVDDIKVFLADRNDYEIPVVIGYQTAGLENSAENTYDIRFVAKTNKELGAIRVGFKVEYRYVVNDVAHKNTKMLTCSHLYSSVSAGYGSEEIVYDEFGLIALHLDDIPKDIDIVFTVTPFSTFWSDFSSQEIYEYGETQSYTIAFSD